MNLYSITSDGETSIVEATCIRHAIDLWQKAIGQVDDEPEEVTFITCCIDIIKDNK